MTSVATVIVTFNRKELLRESLTAHLAQTRPADEILVVDNNSGDGTGDMLAAEFPDVVHLRLDDNTGPAGGFAHGMREALDRGHQWMWLFNDDDQPAPDALATLLKEELPPRTGMVAGWVRDDTGAVQQLGLRWRNRHRPLPPPAGGGSYDADVLIFCGVLVNAETVAEIGFPKAEYFAMCEELDYCLRARDTGWRIRILPQPLTVTLHAGAATAPLWRLYYQSRNQLAMSLQRRSAAEVAHYAVRQAKFTVATLTSKQDRKAARTKARLTGAWHALRGVTGRSVDPAGS